MPKPRTIRLDGITDAAWQLIADKAAQCQPPASPQDYIRYRLNLIAAEIHKEKEQGK